MNITHAPDFSRGWSRLKSHHLAAFAAAGLAIVAVTAAATINFKGSSSGPARAGAAASIAAFSPVAHERYITYYLVASDAERAFAEKNIQEAALERMSVGADEKDLSVSVIQFQTPQDEAVFSTDVNATMSSDPNLHAQIVDLRGKVGAAAPDKLALPAPPVSRMGAEWCKAQAPDESTRELLGTIGYC